MDEISKEVPQSEKIPGQQEENVILGNAINTVLEMEMAFKLFSYRVTTREAFLVRVNDLCEFYVTEKAKIETDD